VRRTVFFALVLAFVLAAATTASARVIQRAQTHQRFGSVTASGKVSYQERFVSVKVVNIPSRKVWATLSVACLRPDNTARVASQSVKSRMAPFTLTVRRPRVAGRRPHCFASATAELAQQLLPADFTSSIYIKLSAWR
jgi:hypothetical protein